MSFWENKSVMILGASGFLGSYLQNALNKLGAILTTPTSSQIDLRRQEEVESLLNTHTPEILINCAGKVGGINENASKPAEFFYDNITIGLNVLHSASISGVKKLIQIGSTCSYPAMTPASYHLPMGPRQIWQGYPESTNSAYGIAKRSLIEMAKAYKTQYGFDTITVILANLYGPDCRSSHVIPEMIEKFKAAAKENKEKVTLLGTGKPTREFLYVDDAIEGILTAAEKSQEPVINCGSGEEVSILMLANTIKELTNFAGRIEWDTNSPDGQSNRLLDSSDLKNLGWTHKTTLRDGLNSILARQEKQEARA